MKILAAFLSIILLEFSLIADTYYVANAPSNGNGTYSNPFNNFNSALSAAYPGDTVFAMPATYHLPDNISTVRNGSASQRITIKAFDPSDKPVLTRSGKVLNVNHSYHTFEGLIMDGQFGDRDVVEINSGGDYCLIRSCEIKNGVKDGIDLHAADFVLIENCEIHHMLAGSYTNQMDAHGIVATGQKNLTIRGCNIYYASGDCFQTDPNRGLPLWDEVLIEDCLMWTGPLPADAAEWNAGEIPGENAVDTKINPDSVNTGYRPKITIRNVEAFGFAPGFISNRAAFNIKEQVECKIENVLVYDNEIGFRLRGPGSRGGAHVTIINAIAYGNVRIFRTEDDIELLHIYNGTFDKDPNNDYFQNVSGGYDPNGFELLNSLFMGAKPSDAFDPSNLSAGPSFFVDAANRDYHLAANSPAIDAGVDIAEVTKDYDGNPRTSGAYDAGAYEYTGAVGVDLYASTVRGFELFDNYPNPFNPKTHIEFSLAAPSNVILEIYNSLGEHVTTLADNRLNEGMHRYKWNGLDHSGRQVSSGTYYYRIRVGDFAETRKMLLVR